MLMHQYWGFGLNIESEIAFPELLPSTFNNADLTIRIGDTPAELNGDNVVQKLRLSVSPSEYLLDIFNIAKYYASNGNQIIIQRYDDADESSVRLFMLSNAIAAILHQRNSIPFHASGIFTSAGLVLFTGSSGSGKSTTVYGLMQRGYKLFTDDVCVLHYNKATGLIEATPSYPMMKLWENTLEIIPADGIERSYRVRPKLPKYGVFNHHLFNTASLPVLNIYVLDSYNFSAVHTCKQLNKIESFNVLQGNTYRRLQVDLMQLHSLHFHLISQLANQATVFQVNRKKDDTVESYLDFIIDQLSKHERGKS
jgi:hypothetical protein